MQGTSQLCRLSCCCLLPSLRLTASAKEAAAGVPGVGKERKGREAACVLTVPGSHPPALTLTKGGFASFSLLLYSVQQKMAVVSANRHLASAKIFAGFRDLRQDSKKNEEIMPWVFTQGSCLAERKI